MNGILTRTWILLKSAFKILMKIVRWTLIIALLCLLSMFVMFVAFPITLVLQCLEPIVMVTYWLLSGVNYYDKHEPVIIKFFELISLMLLDDVL